VSAGEALAHRVLPSLYRDSVALMLMSSEVQAIDGVISASAVMATPANLDMLARSGLLPTDLDAAADDLVVAVRARDSATAERSLVVATDRLVRSAASSGAVVDDVRPATVDEGLAAFPEASLVSVSVAGPFAPLLVKQALMRNRHVFCFSDNVAIEDEVALKHLAVQRGLLLMGPDCGTALIDGTPLGFVNVVSPGPVGIVSASGTGAQEVMCRLDALGVGVSQVIGVGGRDLAEEVGGVMTHAALDLLAADTDTECVVLVGKPPGARVAEELHARLARFPKPVVTCLVGGAARDVDGHLVACATLAEAARRAAVICGVPLNDETADLPSTMSVPSAAGVVGLFTGGTLASEARHLLSNAGVAARVIDLGDDEYTVGRPHPMIDPRQRAVLIADCASDPAIGILLVDLVLGRGAMPDPASPLAVAVSAARDVAARDGRSLTVIASVCGTPRDPQGIDDQRRILTDAGVVLAPSNAAAATLAATLAGAVA
jgi:FdrA protein